MLGNAATGESRLGAGDYATALRNLDRANELRPQEHFTFWLGVTYRLLNRLEDEQASWDRAASLTGAGTDLCLQQRVLAKLALLTNRIDDARKHYAQAMNDSCQILALRIEQRYLLLLAQLFPDRDDIREICKWFEGQLQQKSQR